MGSAYIIPDGVHTTMVYADKAKRIAESDETNNKLSQSISVP
jgi:subtilase family serine protease